MINTDSSAIYEMHNATFLRMSAFVVLKDTNRFATVALKYPKNDEGRIWAYVHILGTPMARGHSSGGSGYAKRSTAVRAAAQALVEYPAKKAIIYPEAAAFFTEFRTALLSDSGCSWEQLLLAGGFTMLQAV